ncbi:cytochrome P450 [Streptomyces sp. AJS327]|uniref:cytochrome P450 n=1 Tax=Streptomyces sp. AJS327 TaxID=2545265 RepID=UPI0015DFAF72|nr:cytochrome P450 [Streptomyces sp. AJS327]
MAEFRERGLTRVRCPTGITAWLVSRYPDVREVLGDAERFSSRPGQAAHVLRHQDPQLPVMNGDFTRMDGPEYQRYRRHFGPEIGMPKRLAELRPEVRRITDERLDALGERGQEAEFYHEFAIPITTAVIAGLMGVPYSDRQLFHDAAAAMFASGTDEADIKRGTDPLFAYVHQLVRRRRADPGEDSISRMIERSAAADEPFTDHELMMMGASLLISGFDTTATVLTHSVLALLRHPEQWRRLLDDPGLVPNAVEELARFFGGSPGLTREVTRDTEIGGQPVAKGEFVVLAVQAADRDPHAFTDPDRLDVGRELGEHLGFGYGTHQCVGQQTARLEMTVALETLLRRVPSLRLGVPPEEIVFKSGTPVVGPAALPIAWDAILPAEEGR